MNQYETVFIVKTDIAKEQINNVIDKITNFIKANGKITKTTDLGIKKIAFDIKNYNQGYYYVVEFNAEDNTIHELEKLYRTTDEILKYMTIKNREEVFD